MFNTIGFYDDVSFVLHQTVFWTLKLTQNNRMCTASKNDYITLRIQRRFIMSLKTHQKKKRYHFQTAVIYYH